MINLRRAASLACFGALAALASCSSGENSGKTDKNITIQLVHPPELRSYLSERKEDFYLADPQLPDGTKIRLELVSEMGVSAADRIGRGDLKPDGWLSPSSALVSFANSRVRNLGGRQEQCVTLFSTPMVLATQIGHLNDLKINGRSPSWNELFEGVASQPDDRNFEESLLSLSHGTPKTSSTGLAALIELSYLATHPGATSLSLTALKTAQSLEYLKKYEGLVSGYGLSDNFLLARSMGKESRRIRMTLTTEQQLASFNLNLSHREETPADQRLVALYPADGSFWQDYQFCLTEADWETPARKAAAKLFRDFLGSPDSQQAIKVMGFRPSLVKIPEVAPLTPQYGVRTDLPSTSFLPVAGEIVEYLISEWSQIVRPAAVTFVLDTSGSMEGLAINAAKDQLRFLAARLSHRDLKSLITFSTSPRVAADFTADAPAIIEKIDQAQAVGGSAIYDAIKSAVQLITSRDLRAYRKTIIVLTDGSDKNSDVTLKALNDLILDKFGRHDITLVIIGIRTEGENFSDLQAIAAGANGVFRSVEIQDLATVFDDVFRNTQGMLEG